MKSEIFMDWTDVQFLLQASNTRTLTSLQRFPTDLAGEQPLGCDVVCLKAFGVFMYLWGFAGCPPG